MKPGQTLFVVKLEGEPPVILETIAYDGPRGNRVRLRVGEMCPNCKHELPPADLLEGPARQLHLKIRGWVRHQKALRGDTPRGRAKLASAKEGDHAAAAR